MLRMFRPMAGVTLPPPRPGHPPLAALRWLCAPLHFAKGGLCPLERPRGREIIRFSDAFWEQVESGSGTTDEEESDGCGKGAVDAFEEGAVGWFSVSASASGG